MLRVAADGSSGSGRFIFCERKATGRMDFRVKSNGTIQAVAEDGTPLGGKFTFHYTYMYCRTRLSQTLMRNSAGAYWPQY